MCGIIRNVFYKLKYKNNYGLRICEAGKNVQVVLKSGGKAYSSEGLRVRSNTTLSAIEGSLCIGAFCFFNRNCNIVARERIVIGDNVSCGPNVCIFDHDHQFDKNGVAGTKYKSGEVVIEDGCWIGASAIILRNTHIGEGCVIGAGTIVRGEIPPHSIVTMDRELHIHPIVRKEKNEV